MSPLHRGINISSSSIGSQEVNLEFMCLVEMQSKSMASSHIGGFRSLSRVRLEDAAAQKGQEIAGVIILLKNQEQYLHLKNCLPNISELICVARRQEESRQGRFAGLARLFSLPGKLHILFRGFSPSKLHILVTLSNCSPCQAPLRGEQSSTAPSSWFVGEVIGATIGLS